MRKLAFILMLAAPRQSGAQPPLEADASLQAIANYHYSKILECQTAKMQGNDLQSKILLDNHKMNMQAIVGKIIAWTAEVESVNGLGVIKIKPVIPHDGKLPHSTRFFLEIEVKNHKGVDAAELKKGQKINVAGKVSMATIKERPYSLKTITAPLQIRIDEAAISKPKG